MTGSPQPAAAADSALDLLILAELNPDVLVDAPRADVAFGQVETQMTAGELTLGSSGAITAVAARTFGLSVAFAAVVGDDMLGELSLNLLSDAGVDTGAVLTRSDLRTGLTVVVNAPGGDRALLTFPGAMAALTVADVPEQLFHSARHVHVSSLFLQRALVPDLPELFAQLRRRGISTSVDTGWDPAQRWTALADLVPYVDHLLPNEAELRALNAALQLGADPTALDWVEEAAAALSRRGPCVAVKLGGHGGLLCAAGQRHRLTTAPSVPVDSTGAGDNFNAGYLAALLTGAGPQECLASAVAAGTLSIRGRGGTGGIGTPAELRSLVAQLLPTVCTGDLARPTLHHRAPVGTAPPTDSLPPVVQESS